MTVVRGGGLAGLVRSTSVDTSTLDAASAEALRARVRAAPLASASAGIPPATPRPDHEAVEIIVESGEPAVAVLVSPDDPGIRELIEWVESAPQRSEQLGPPGESPGTDG